MRSRSPKPVSFAILGQGEWLGCLVVCFDESMDVLLHLFDGGEGSAVQ
jgi:hypothetical protein